MNLETHGQGRSVDAPKVLDMQDWRAFFQQSRSEGEYQSAIANFERTINVALSKLDLNDPLNFETGVAEVEKAKRTLTLVLGDYIEEGIDTHVFDTMSPHIQTTQAMLEEAKAEKVSANLDIAMHALRDARQDILIAVKIFADAARRARNTFAKSERPH